MSATRMSDGVKSNGQSAGPRTFVASDPTEVAAAMARAGTGPVVRVIPRRRLAPADGKSTSDVDSDGDIGQDEDSHGFEDDCMDAIEDMASKVAAIDQKLDIIGKALVERDTKLAAHFATLTDKLQVVGALLTHKQVAGSTSQR